MRERMYISHDEVMIRELRKDREFAIEYLKAVTEEDDPQVLEIALRQVAAAGRLNERGDGVK